MKDVAAILKLVQDSGVSPKAKEHVCQFCQREFTKLSTLSTHLCEPKRRVQQSQEVGVQLGFQTFNRFYQMTQGPGKAKSYDDFIKSTYYTAFVKYGRYLVDIKAVNAEKFTEWLFKNNKRLDDWCKDSLYSTWLLDFISKENTQDALERSLRVMQEYADNDKILEENFTNYFKLGSSNRICHHITHGRISPWVIFNCNTGINWLEGLSEEQLGIIMPWINPEVWNKKFNIYKSDVLWIKGILSEVGL